MSRLREAVEPEVASAKVAGYVGAGLVAAAWVPGRIPPPGPRAKKALRVVVLGTIGLAVATKPVTASIDISTFVARSRVLRLIVQRVSNRPARFGAALAVFAAFGVARRLVLTWALEQERLAYLEERGLAARYERERETLEGLEALLVRHPSGPRRLG